MEAILTQLRVACSMFDSEFTSYQPDAVRALQRGLHRIGWQLDAGGYLSPLGVADMTTGGRDALDEQLDRMRRASDDPALLIGTAKDLLEAVAKFVLEELGALYNPKADFAEALVSGPKPTRDPPEAGRWVIARRLGDPDGDAKRLEYRRLG